MPTVSIAHQRGAAYHVSVVADDGSSTSHVVTVWPSDVERYAPGSTPEQLLEASFEFLLAREPKEAILARFELPIIERYFPDYASTVRIQLGDRTKN
jgi:hypothetical protein